MPLVVFRFNENEPEHSYQNKHEKIDVNVKRNFGIKLSKIFKIRLQFNLNLVYSIVSESLVQIKRLFEFNDISYFARVKKQEAINRYK